MLYPSMKDLMEKVSSRYMLVNAMAKRARQIAEEAEVAGVSLTEKPVCSAINELAEGKLIIKEND